MWSLLPSLALVTIITAPELAGERVRVSRTGALGGACRPEKWDDQAYLHY